MRKYLFITIINLVIILLQESFSWEFFGQTMNPSFIIAISFAFLMIDDHPGALFSAFIGGLWLDLVGVGIVGLSSFALVLLLAVSLWIKKSMVGAIWFQATLIVGATIIFKLIISYPELIYSWKLFFSAVLSSIISLGFYYILSRTKHRYLSFEFRIKA